MSPIRRSPAWYALLACLLCLALPVSAAADRVPAFPGAQGWAAHTPGGRGGQILRVTTLAADGPGSLRAAVETRGPRVVVFEVGGVIDLGMKELRISEPYLTIAGQTAPHPGITIIKGGLTIGSSLAITAIESERPRISPKEKHEEAFHQRSPPEGPPRLHAR